MHDTKSETQTYATIALNRGHLAVAEYNEDPEEERSSHNRTTSKFQWQNVLSGVGEGGRTTDGGRVTDGGDGINVGRQLSRCYSARTRTVRRSLNPVFNEEFRFEVADDTLLQVSLLQIVKILNWESCAWM
jgi:hypothetical protein